MNITTNTRSGSIRLVLFLVGITIACFWKGGQELYTALTNRRPTAISYEEYLKTKPKAAWLMLTNCALDLSRAASHTYQGAERPYELFVPVSSRALMDDEKIAVMVATKNPRLIDTVMEMKTLKSETEQETWAIKNHERLFPMDDVQGLVRFGLDMKESERRKIAELDKNIVADFIILNDGAKPSLTAGLGFCAIGAAALAGGFLMVRSRREASASDVL